MEIFKLRYNLYKYLIANNFVFEINLNKSIIFKNLIYTTIVFFFFIFIVGYEYLNYYIIYFVILLCFLIYYIELIYIKLDLIINDEYFQIYANNYKGLNKIFNINYDNISKDDISMSSHLLSSSSSSKTVIRIDKTNAGKGYVYNHTYNLQINGSKVAEAKGLIDGSLSDAYNFIGASGVISESTLITIQNAPPSITGSNIATFKAVLGYVNINTNIKDFAYAYNNLNNDIKRKIKVFENVLEEDIDDTLNLLKLENDVLKYIDIYNDKYNFLNKFLYINENNNEIYNKINNDYSLNSNITVNGISIATILNEIDINSNKSYLINLELLEKNINNSKEDYITNIYNSIRKELDIKDLSNLFKSKYYIQEAILKRLDEFNWVFIKLLIVVILLITIVSHIFFIKLYRYL